MLGWVSYIGAWIAVIVVPVLIVEIEQRVRVRKWSNDPVVIACTGLVDAANGLLQGAESHCSVSNWGHRLTIRSQKRFNFCTSSGVNVLKIVIDENAESSACFGDILQIKYRLKFRKQGLFYSESIGFARNRPDRIILDVNEINDLTKRLQQWQVVTR